MAAASASTRPRVTSRFCAIRIASTSRPSTVSVTCERAPAVSVQISGSVSHSACQPPKPRSCSCTIALNITDTSPGTRVDADNTTAEATGLRLCGIVDDPPRPGAEGSNASPISVCINSDTSRAILPKVPTTRPSVVATSATLSRWLCHGTSGRAKSSSVASAFATSRPRSSSAAKVPTAPPN